MRDVILKRINNIDNFNALLIYDQAQVIDYFQKHQPQDEDVLVDETPNFTYCESLLKSAGFTVANSHQLFDALGVKQHMSFMPYTALVLSSNILFHNPGQTYYDIAQAEIENPCVVISIDSPWQGLSEGGKFHAAAMFRLAFEAFKTSALRRLNNFK